MSGVPPPAYGPPTDKRAIWALVLGILGFVICLFLGPVAWYLGGEAKSRIRRSGGTLGGEGLAIAGQVLGVMQTVFLAVLLLLLFAVCATSALPQTGQGR